MSNSRRSIALDTFDPRNGFVRGRSRFTEMVWYLVKRVFFLSALPWPSSCKAWLLRLFGADVGVGCVLKPRINIHFPWKLRLGNHVWIGEEAFILNFEPIAIASHCCISQRAFLCTGNHDYRQPDMPYRNAPITVEEGAWIGAGVFVGPGVIVGTQAVICAGSVLVRSAAAATVFAGNPCVPVRNRWPVE